MQRQLSAAHVRRRRQVRAQVFPAAACVRRISILGLFIQADRLTGPPGNTACSVPSRGMIPEALSGMNCHAGKHHSRPRLRPIRLPSSYFAVIACSRTPSKWSACLQVSPVSMRACLAANWSDRSPTTVSSASAWVGAAPGPPHLVPHLRILRMQHAQCHQPRQDLRPDAGVRAALLGWNHRHCGSAWQPSDPPCTSYES